MIGRQTFEVQQTVTQTFALKMLTINTDFGSVRAKLYTRSDSSEPAYADQDQFLGNVLFILSFRESCRYGLPNFKRLMTIMPCLIPNKIMFRRQVFSLTCERSIGLFISKFHLGDQVPSWVRSMSKIYGFQKVCPKRHDECADAEKLT